MLVTNCPDPDSEQVGERTFSLRILNSRTGQEVRTFGVNGPPARVVAWSPDGSMIATSDRLASSRTNQSVSLWDVKSGRRLHFIEGAHKPSDGNTIECRDIAWSPDSSQIASCGGDKCVKIWQASTGKLEKVLGGHAAVLGSVEWSPDGSWLASSDWHHTVKIWDAETWEAKWEMRVKPFQGSTGSNGTSAIAWNTKSNHLSARFGRGRLAVWNVDQHRPPELVWTTEAHSSNIRAVDWNSDGRRIASLSEDRLLKIWDAETGRELLPLDVGFSGACSLAWSPDGARLACNNFVDEMLIWDASRAINMEKSASTDAHNGEEAKPLPD